MARKASEKAGDTTADDTTRTRLLDAAEKLFAERGFEGASVREINAEADVNSGAIHYYFKAKEDLFRAVIRRRAEVLSNDRLTRLARCGIGEDRAPMLEQIIKAYITPYTNPALGGPEERLRFARLRARLMAEQTDADPSPLGTEHEHTGQKFVQALRDALPGLPLREVRVRYLIMWSALNTLSAGLGHVALGQERGEPRKHALTEFEEMVPDLVTLFAALFQRPVAAEPDRAPSRRGASSEKRDRPKLVKPKSAAIR
jgi:AcrR family transcriptional regulator